MGFWSRIGMLLLTATVLGSGCMPKRVDLVALGTVQLRMEATGQVRLSAKVYDEAGALVVLSYLAQGPLVPGDIPGHVDVTLLASDGHVLATQRATQVTSRHSHPTESTRATFRAVFATFPPPGATVYVRHHTQPHG